MDEREAQADVDADVDATVVQTAVRPDGDAAVESKTRRQPPYNVILLNDEEHSFPYVIDLLTKLFKHSQAAAEQLTLRIHTAGRAVVMTTHRELAELKRDQVLGYGPDPSMSISKGPIGCVIEAVGG